MKLASALCLLALSGLGSCGIGATYTPNAAELEAFNAAGPIEPELDEARLLSGIPHPGPYRVVSGDLLEIKGPGVFFGLGPDLSTGEDVHLTRVSDEGRIQLPIGGDVDVAGKTLAEVEDAIAEVLHPKYLLQRPSIVAAVAEHRTVKVAIMGAVEEPGIHELRSDQLSLFGALTQAGGILKANTLQAAGARLIRIRRPHEERAAAFALPVKGLNVPFSDVALAGGETIEVQRWQPKLFTVVGLVMKPGAYEYPPEASYNLMQAIAMAGGVDRVAAPPYATILRRDAQRQIIGVTFEINGDDIAEASSTPIKPGDVIALQHTVGSWTRSFLAQVFRIQVNFFADPLNRF